MVTLKVQNREVQLNGILFDKDGTLLDFMHLWGKWAQLLFDAMNDYLSMYGQELAPGFLGAVRDSQGTVTGCDPRGPLAMASMDEVTAIAAARLYEAGIPWNDSIRLTRQFREQADIHLEREQPAKAMPGLAAFLQQCSAHKLAMAVITSDTTSSARKHLQWLGMHNHFHQVIGHEQVEFGKPHPEMIEASCARMGLVPSETVMIGDSNGDMQMGKQAGVALTIGIYSNEEGKAALAEADVQIASYDELQLQALDR
ncbi:HAD family hydrolase [Paenibacillus sp. MZ04-78.2]|uniref:HAD family hydrolase n=1 Tax=Paenibacillus sp. MZ04-78.2 TaxID=2962034 RepID=UPI0020B63F22|nr:HAD family hydrolase [Paenibacillus sp. MZ04-78.2]MCP3776596.1 HAD family hydrolase [Paenibacillus sp. MZ04-78.2]